MAVFCSMTNKCPDILHNFCIILVPFVSISF
jgi:hypothetical protein